MKSVLGYFMFFILIAGSSFSAVAQDKRIVTNVTKMSFTNDSTQLAVDYDLIWPDTAQLFDVELKISYGNRIIQPKEEELTGSCGYKIAPGREKTILWDMPPELKRDIDLFTSEVIASKTTYSKADFDFKIITPTPPYEVKFNNISSNSDRYNWDFGDPKSLKENISSLESPVHQYRSAGDYNISLITGNSKNNTADTIIKVLSLVKNDEIARYKTLKTVWLSAAVVSAGVGAYGFIRHNNLYNEWKEKGTSDLESKYKTYRIVGPASLVVSGFCISQVFAQSKKIREAEKKLTFNLTPFENGIVAGASINF